MALTDWLSRSTTVIAAIAAAPPTAPVAVPSRRTDHRRSTATGRSRASRPPTSRGLVSSSASPIWRPGSQRPGPESASYSPAGQPRVTAGAIDQSVPTTPARATATPAIVSAPDIRRAPGAEATRP
jgi:hypothetical protein